MLASMNMMGFLLTKDYEQARAFTRASWDLRL